MLSFQAALSIDNARLYIQLSEHNLSLELEVRRRTHELEEKNRQLSDAKEAAEKSSRIKADFLSNMSHEIRTPLNGILGLTQVMMTEVSHKDHIKYLEMIHYSGKNLTQIINDILDFSKIESGKLELENLNFNFGRIINNEIERYRFLAEQKGLYLNCEIDSSFPLEVIGDQVRISQVVNNLISNSIKFTSEGGITVKFSMLASKNHEALIQCKIIDTGIGIAKEAQIRIFQSFDQADTSVTRKYGGTGLGLSIVKSLVEAMGGTIGVQSPINPALGNGSCFTFTLRLKLPAAKTNQVVNTTNKNTLRKAPQILVVDDNPVNLLVARKMLERFGATAITIDNGSDAIDLITQKEFDLVLMDLQMPLLDGYATAREMRKLNYTKPIIALSASAYQEDIKNSLEAGMNGHLHKPFTETELFQVIDSNS